jgi:predicted nucleic acid-binding protein
MPTSAEPELLVDTSVAVALCVADHEGRAPSRGVVEGRRIGIAGHAAWETFSVLTRLPPPARLSPAVASRVLAANFPLTRFLGQTESAALLERLEVLGIGGGSIYDALVGSVAVAVGVPLVTRDRRALPTYRLLDVDVLLAL